MQAITISACRTRRTFSRDSIWTVTGAVNRRRRKRNGEKVVTLSPPGSREASKADFFSGFETAIMYGGSRVRPECALYPLSCPRTGARCESDSNPEQVPATNICAGGIPGNIFAGISMVCDANVPAHVTRGGRMTSAAKKLAHGIEFAV